MKKLLCLILSLALLCSLTLVSCKEKDSSDTNNPRIPFECEIDIAQDKEEQSATLSWKGVEKLTSIEVTDVYGELTSVQTFDVEELSEGKVTLPAAYGNHSYTVRAYAEDGAKLCKKELTLSLSADEYVIAPISGSMPQLYFTLNLKEINKGGEIPTFVWLARPDSWNWDNLPENVYAMPNVKREEVLIHNNYDRMVEMTDKLIEDLYKANPASKFNLYVNDYNSYLYLKLLAGNGIPEENYYVTLLSDGGASYKDFNAAFNSEDPSFDADAKYADMALKLKTLYTEVRDAKDYENGGFGVDTSTFRQFAYVAAREMSNVEWWILRPRAGVLCSPDEDFIARVLGEDKTEGIIEERNFASPLKAMSDEDKADLKKLYNFNDEMFNAAEEQGKKAMMILGSWAKPENEPDFESYVKLIKAFYGEDDFVYYYKGHPNTPTSLYPDKQKQLDELDLFDVESSINAELILFFYPDIYMCGYNSSTFMSVESPEMACAMFNMTKDAAFANEGTEGYRELIGVYLSKITDDSPYASLATENDCFAVEYNNEQSDADLAVFDAKEGTFKYYTSTDGVFTEITK